MSKYKIIEAERDGETGFFLVKKGWFFNYFWSRVVEGFAGPCSLNEMNRWEYSSFRSYEAAIDQYKALKDGPDYKVVAKKVTKL